MSLTQQIFCAILCIVLLNFSCIDRETSVGTGKLQPDKILSISGNDQSGVVGNDAFTELTVRVLDASNQPVAKVKVEFLVQYGSASLSDTVATTNFDGIAKTKVTYGSVADTIGIYAIVLGVKGSPVLFSLRSLSANVSLLKAISDTVIVGLVASARQETVRATDSYGNPVKNAIIKFEPKSGKGSVADVNVPTNSLGIASTLWTLDSLVGTNSLEVSIVGKSMTPLKFTALALPGNAANLVALAGGKQFGFVDAELPVALEIAAQDRYGNYLTSTSVQFMNANRVGGPIFTNRFDKTNVVPVRTVVTVILGPTIGLNRVLASMPPASPLDLRYNGYSLVIVDVPTSASGVVTLKWNATENSNFSSYKIFRSSEGTISTSSDLIATITDPAATSCSDSSAIVGTQYFYAVYVSFMNGEAFFSNGVSITP